MYQKRSYALAALSVLLPITLVACSSHAVGRPNQRVGASAAPTVRLQPLGPIPRGWIGYSSPNQGFGLAHPQGWTVDESAAGVGQTSFLEPGKEPVDIT